MLREKKQFAKHITGYECIYKPQQPHDVHLTKLNREHKNLIYFPK